MDPYLLNIDLNVLLQVVAVQVEDQVMDKVEAVTDNNEWQLVSEFGFLFKTQDEETTVSQALKLVRTLLNLKQ